MRLRLSDFGVLIIKSFLMGFYWLCIIAGGLCALVSGLIELEFFNQLFEKVIREKPLLELIPFLVVCSFETVKVFLVFYGKACMYTSNARYAAERHKFTGLRSILILI